MRFDEGCCVSEPVIIHSEDVELKIFPGGGRAKRLIHPSTVGPTKLYFGVIEVDPGLSPHRWHTHTIDRGDGFEVLYTEDYEEAYYIIRGKGTMYWKAGDEERSKKVGEGDAIHLPIGVAKHQMTNTGRETMLMVWFATPPTRIVK